MSGILYGVGTGPGDPELMTLKAVRVLQTADVIAGPGDKEKPGIAFQIAEAAVPEIREKEWFPIRFPMTRDTKQTASAHKKAADELTEKLKEGRNIAFLTLGDPMIYSTFSYIIEYVRSAGCRVEIINGVPSFCAAAAAALTPIAVGDEKILITTSAADHDISAADTVIFLKAGTKLQALKNQLAGTGKNVFMTENCGMPGEQIYRGVDSIPNESGYFSLVIASSGFREKGRGKQADR